MQVFLRQIERLPATLATLLGFILILITGMVDRITGYELGFSVFYLVPILLVTWQVSRNTGIFFCVLSIISWNIADLGIGFTNNFAIFWNDATRLIFYLLITWLLTSFKKALDKEQNLARQDFLTGLANRRSFCAYAMGEIERCHQTNTPLTIVYLDCDDFKEVNDKLGHNTGDKLLREVGQVLDLNSRPNDLAARLGGDEFAMLLPNTNYDFAKVFLPKIQNLLLEAMQRNAWPVTFSIGSVTFRRPPASVETMLDEADKLMYEVKKTGKNMLELIVSKE